MIHSIWFRNAKHLEGRDWKSGKSIICFSLHSRICLILNNFPVCKPHKLFVSMSKDILHNCRFNSPKD